MAHTLMHLSWFVHSLRVHFGFVCMRVFDIRRSSTFIYIYLLSVLFDVRYRWFLFIGVFRSWWLLFSAADIYTPKYIFYSCFSLFSHAHSHRNSFFIIFCCCCKCNRVRGSNARTQAQAHTSSSLSCKHIHIRTVIDHFVDFLSIFFSSLLSSSLARWFKQNGGFSIGAFEIWCSNFSACNSRLSFFCCRNSFFFIAVSKYRSQSALQCEIVDPTKSHTQMRQWICHCHRAIRSAIRFTFFFMIALIAHSPSFVAVVFDLKAHNIHWARQPWTWTPFVQL